MAEKRHGGGGSLRQDEQSESRDDISPIHRGERRERTERYGRGERREEKRGEAPNHEALKADPVTRDILYS